MNRSAASATLLSLLLSACEQDAGPGPLVGQLESERIEISADADEPIIAIAVREGEEVAAGDPLFEQAADRIDAAIREAEAELAESRARLDELIRGPRQERIRAAKAALQGARQELDFREAEYERARRILERQLAAPETADRARAALDGAAADVDVKEAQLAELLEGTTVEELRQAENAVARRTARLEVLSVDRQRLTPRAPRGGLIDSVLFETGERPVRGQPVLVLLAGDQPYARVYVPEARRAGVAPGMTARVTVDGLDRPLEGRVRWISSEAAFTPYFALTERDRGRLSYVAEIDVELTPRRLPDGIPVEVVLLRERGEERASRQ